MIKLVVATGTALAVSGTIYITAPLGADIEHKELLKQAGISELVYDCAAGVLNGKTSEELVSFIETDIPQVNTEGETETVSALEECVMQDPLGWHGTDKEQFIPLLGLEE